MGGRRRETKEGFHFRNGFKTFLQGVGGESTDGWYGVGEMGGYKAKGEAQESGGIGREVRDKERIGRKGRWEERHKGKTPIKGSEGHQHKGVKSCKREEG